MSNPNLLPSNHHRCRCRYCEGTNFKPLLQRINGDCDCYLCERKRKLPFLYYDCVELHLSYKHGFDNPNSDIEIIRDEIKSIKKIYKKKKRLFLWYMYCRNKFLQLYIHIKYRPGGSGYFEAMENFYTTAATSRS